MIVKGHVLIVEDQTHTRQVLALMIGKNGYHVTQAASGKRAVQLLKEAERTGNTFDVVLTDIVLGDIDGVEVAKVARSKPDGPEVILLTGHGSLETAMGAIRSQAFDYLLKPCENEELLACIAAALQKHKERQQQHEKLDVLSKIEGMVTQNQEQHAERLADDPSQDGEYPHLATRNHHRHIGSLCIDTDRHTIWFDHKEVSVTPSEYRILECLSEFPGRAFSFAEIVQCMRGRQVEESEAREILRQHIRNLRQKIPRDYLENVYAVGYMLVNPAEHQEVS